MTICYIIVAGNGEYSDRREKPVRVYLDKDKAQAEMVKLDSINSKYLEDQKKYWEEYKTIHHTHYPYGTPERTEMDNKTEALFKILSNEYMGQYLELGYEVSYDTDWELTEAEFFA